MTPDQPTATATPRTDPYTSGFTTTPREAALFKSVACGCASVGMLYDEGLKEAVYGSVRIDLIMWERELSSAQAALAEAKAEVTRLGIELTATNAVMEELKEMKTAVIWEGINKDHVQQIDQLRARVAELEEELKATRKQANDEFDAVITRNRKGQP